MGAWQSSPSNSNVFDNSTEDEELEELEANTNNSTVDEEKYKQSIIKYAPCLDFRYAMSLMLKLKLNPITIITQLNTQKFELSNENEIVIFTDYNCINEYFPFLNEYIDKESTRCIDHNSQVLTKDQTWPNHGFILIKLDKSFAEHVLAIYQSVIHKQYLKSLEEVEN